MALTFTVEGSTRAHAKVVVTGFCVEGAFAVHFVASTCIPGVQRLLELPINLLRTHSMVRILMTNEALMVVATYVVEDGHSVTGESGTRFVVVDGAAVTA